MAITDHVHWFFTPRCNLNCMYCFAPNFSFDATTEKLRALAKILQDEGVKKVTLTGGESTLVGGLVDVLKILSQAGVYTSLHTNATKLTPRKLDNLAGIVGDIAIPIDSTDREIQKRLKKFDYLPVFERVALAIQERGINLGLHTVATALNIDGIPAMRDYLKKKGIKPDYWRIYMFNGDLVEDRFSNVKRFQEVKNLMGGCDYKVGGTDSLFARFLLTEELFSKDNDGSIQFVGVHDYKPPYIFLTNSGEVRICDWFYTDRKPIGNLLTDDFNKIKERLETAVEQGPFFDEAAFAEAETNRPLFARLWDGFYPIEEVEEVRPDSWNQIEHLAGLYESKRERQSVLV